MTNQNEVKQFVRGSISSLVENNRAEAVNLFRGYSVDIPADLSNDNLSFLIYKGIKDNEAFRNSLSTVLTKHYNDVEGKFANASGSGVSLDDVLNPQNVNNLFNTGLDLLSTTLKGNVNQQSEQNAIQYEVAKAKDAQSQADLAAAKAQAAKATSWILPVTVTVIGLVAIGGFYIMYKKRKKA